MIVSLDTVHRPPHTISLEVEFGSRIYLQYYYMSRIIAIRLIFKFYVHTESLGLSSINSQLNLRIIFCMSDVKLTKSSVFN